MHPLKVLTCGSRGGMHTHLCDTLNSRLQSYIPDTRTLDQATRHHNALSYSHDLY